MAYEEWTSLEEKLLPIIVEKKFDKYVDVESWPLKNI